ncbi:UDP-glucose 4-epimerase GalE [Microbacterium arborescens]|uniref:UDP-glucose 4-epimerase n=1 Tax=Microbacterium arborescens TaxID=33883 RepID=A0ABX2WJU6_9MICO|nr:UDP-glucose 4-epimerase GalE [Microbacterium arborescens]OAZ42827.1 UDP-glucose 4-epimerase GalE [Microbacterium arborescens]
MRLDAPKVLITGGAGYIGATVATACIDAGFVPIVIDDLSTGSAQHVAARTFYRGDIADDALVDRVLDEHGDIYAVIHCAARVIVPESVADPLTYYASNVASSVALLQRLSDRGIRRVIFSSSASVYAEVEGGVTEDAPLHPASPYARTKAMTEQILADAATAGQIRAISLRYFNPVGVDPRLRTGPTSRYPSHVLGRIMAAADAGSAFTINGRDWPTRDGSGLRDFIHVWDLARAHVHAVRRFDDVVGADLPSAVLNIGTGTGTTVRELVNAFIRVTGVDVDIRVGARRPGDSAGSYAIVDRAHQLLDWRAERTVDDAIADAWAWNLAQSR